MKFFLYIHGLAWTSSLIIQIMGKRKYRVFILKH